ncbi:MAG: low temperature requirement protein A, partial [Actinomycetota bacterium]|nr:low temperature requirement protein A [Actinomycetota bacterium]
MRPPRLRTFEEADVERRATWLELFFDLVFVVAVAQIALKLSKDTSLAGFGTFCGLFVPALWSWTGFTFYANRFDSDDAVYRVMKMTAMLGIAALAVNVPHATTSHGSVGFALAYVFVRSVLLAMYARARRHVDGAARDIVDRYLTGFGVGAALWLISVAVPTPWRFWLWGAGLAIDLVQPLIGWTVLRAAPVNVPHITERFGLFFIIVLGESIVGVVSGVAGISFGALAILVSTASFAIAACMWWIYFDFADTSVIGRGLLGLVYMYGHFPLLAGVAVVGVGTKLAIHGAGAEHLTGGARWALGGGIAAYLLALAIFHVSAEWTTPRDRVLVARLALAAAGLVLAAVGGALPPLLFVGVLALALVGLLVLEARSFPE